MRTNRSPHARTRGFTLIEVLVALFVVSVGLLGLAGMKTASMQATYGSYNRAQAINLAYAVIDRMRANRDAALAGAYDRGFSDPEPSCGGRVADCDLSDWLGRLDDSLPNARGAIAVGPNGSVTIRTRWDRDREERGLGAGAGGGDVTFTVDTRI